MCISRANHHICTYICMYVLQFKIKCVPEKETVLFLEKWVSHVYHHIPTITLEVLLCIFDMTK